LLFVFTYLLTYFSVTHHISVLLDFSSTVLYVFGITVLISVRIIHILSPFSTARFPRVLILLFLSRFSVDYSIV